MCPGRSSAPTEPFHRKARTGFKSYKLAKADRSSLTTSSPWVSLFQPTRYHDLCFITPSTCYCVRPLNGLRYFWALFRLRKYGIPRQPDMRPFLSLTLWTSHELGWPSPSPRTHVCVGYFTSRLLSNSARLFFCVLVIWTILQGWNACLSVYWRKHASTLQPFSRHCKFSFRGLVWLHLTSVLSISEQNGLTA